MSNLVTIGHNGVDCLLAPFLIKKLRQLSRPALLERPCNFNKSARLRILDFIKLQLDEISNCRRTT